MFLIVSCPCALVISIPLTFFGGIGAASKRGVLVKGGNYLEALNKVSVVVFDKTGTLTKGVFEVANIIPAAGYQKEQVLEYAAQAESYSNHPIAKSILATYGKPIDQKQFSDFEEISGHGISVMVQGKKVLAGNSKLMESEKIAYAACDAAGTKFYVAADGSYVGCILIADEVKPDSKCAIAELKKIGVEKTVMLTGDDERIGKSVADELGLDAYYAQLLPDQKVEKLEMLDKQKRQGSKLAFVGDGINDAPALTRADVGIAIGAGTDVAIDAADVVLMKSRLSDVPAAIRLSRATLHNIHENLFWAFAYNVLGIPLAAGVFIPLLHWQMNPMYGAAAMSLSSFCVVSNALRLNLFDIRSTKHDHKRKAHKTSKKENTTMNKTIKIEGMMCGHCEATVKKALEALDGVSAAEVSHTAGTAVVTLDKPVDDTVLKKAVEDKDYTVTGIE